MSSIAEEYIPEDKYTGLSSNDDQLYDADDLSSLLSDEVEVSIQEEIPLAEDVSENTALEELETLYNASAEATTAEPECIQDDIPVLPELEAVYASSDESTGESLLQELEAMLSADSVEPVVNSITDEIEIPEATEHSANESESSGMSALNELKAFLGDAASNEDGESDDIDAGYDEYSIESRRSVFDELQSLLQSCINELKATAEGDSASSILSTDVDYPSHDELKNLLETKLSQLIKISTDLASSDYMAEGMSALGELSDILGETEISSGVDVSDTSVSLDEADEYLSALESDDEFSADETAATDSVLDELKELLGESFDMETEAPVSSSASDYSMADESDETPLLDTLEDMLSGAGETEDSELLQDYSTVSVTGTGDSEKKEISVLEEYAAYMDGSSDLLDIVSSNQAEATETETESAFEEGDSTSDTLQQLEAMLNKSSASTDDETSKTTQLIEDDVSIGYEMPQVSGRNEEEKHEHSSELKHRVAAAALTTEGQLQNSLHEAEIDNRLPVVGMSLLAAAVIGVIVFWNMSGDQHSQANDLQTGQNPSLVKSVTVKAEPKPKPKPFAPPAIVETEPELVAAEEVKAVTPVLPENTGNIDDSPAIVERSEASYENETYDSYEKKQYDLDEEPVQYNIDEPINNEVTGSGLEMDVLQAEQAETAENRLKELIVQQEKQLDNNEKSLNLLNERVVETESSISKLQLAVEKNKQPESVQSVSSITSEMNAIHSSKQAAGDLQDQTYTIWSVHLLSFYGKPPPAGELDFLDAAGVPYKIKKTIINDGVWYRVLVNNSTEYSAAKEYAGMLEERLGMKKIWISKKQYAYE